MAGGGGALGVERAKRGKASKRKKMKRVGFHLDMTPLVDITFLLLTFFMFTTTMAAPQVMEMSIPPEQDVEVKVNMDELLTLFVHNVKDPFSDKSEDKLFWRIGLDAPEELEVKNLKNLQKVRELSFRENTSNRLKENKLIFALKVNSEVNYGLVVKILDELNLAETMIMEEYAKRLDPDTQKPIVRQRRFTIAEISKEELEELELVTGGIE